MPEWRGGASGKLCFHTAFVFLELRAAQELAQVLPTSPKLIQQMRAARQRPHLRRHRQPIKQALMHKGSETQCTLCAREPLLTSLATLVRTFLLARASGTSLRKVAGCRETAKSFARTSGPCAGKVLVRGVPL